MIHNTDLYKKLKHHHGKRINIKSKKRKTNF